MLDLILLSMQDRGRMLRELKRSITLRCVLFKIREFNPLIFFVIVPDKPPLNLKASANTSRSIIVSWDPVPLGHRHGVVIGYKVFYFSLNASSAERVHHNLTVPSTERYTHLSALDSATLYCVKMLAFTRIGNGNISSCVTVKTRNQGNILIGYRFLLPHISVKFCFSVLCLTTTLS